MADKRNSNIELLRIISIVLIIISHACVHTNYPVVDLNNFNFNLFFVQIGHFGCIGNHLFIIISGYYLINSKFKLNKVFSLLLQMLFYSLLIGGIVYLVAPDKFILKDLIKILFPVFWGNWFLIYYLILYILSPYINIFISHLSKNEYKIMLLILITLMYIIPTITLNAWDFNAHSFFIVDYLIGAYINRYVINNENLHKKSFKYLLYTIFLYLIISLSMVLLSYVMNNSIFIRYICFLIGSNFSVLSLLFAVIIFNLYISKKPKSNKIINFISSTMLGIYLIHDNDYLRNIIWNSFFPLDLYITNWYFILILLFKVIIIFLVCFIIESLRKFLLTNIEYKLSNKFKEICGCIIKFFKSFFNKKSI